MKHEAFGPGTRSRQPGDLKLCPVLGATADGLPLLAGASSDGLLVLGETCTPEAGMVAVCKDMPGHTVVLGYVTAAQISGAATIPPIADKDGWIMLGFGESSIMMHPDGRMRVKAKDFTIESAGRLGLRGAWIDLN